MPVNALTSWPVYLAGVVGVAAVAIAVFLGTKPTRIVERGNLPTVLGGLLTAWFAVVVAMVASYPRIRGYVAEATFYRNLIIYGAGGLIAPFIGIKLIDLSLSVLL